jgi:hypothetical protein
VGERLNLLARLTGPPASIKKKGAFRGVLMPSRRDSTSRRLYELFRTSQARRAEQVFEEMILRPAKKFFGELSDTSDANKRFEELFDFSNDVFHAAYSRAALALDETDKDNAPLLTAFHKARLDHKNPLHWRALLSMFAEAHFGKTKTKTPKWDPLTLTDVLLDYHTVKKEKPNAKASDICKELRRDKRFKSKYQHYQFDALRKLVRNARDPKFNKFLQHPEMKDPLLQLIRADYEAKGISWKPEMEAWIKSIIDRSGLVASLSGQPEPIE